MESNGAAGSSGSRDKCVELEMSETRPLRSSVNNEPSSSSSRGGSCEVGRNDSLNSRTGCEHHFVVRDPISESYRSIIEVINRTSNGFKEGKKWKCNASNSFSNNANYSFVNSFVRNSRSNSHISCRSSSRKSCSRKSSGSVCDYRMTHSRSILDDRQMLRESLMGTSMDCPGVGQAQLARNRGKRLVRQKATTAMDDSSEEHLLGPNGTSCETINERPSVSKSVNHLRVGGMPQRQWTIDTCTGLKTPMQEAMTSSASGGTAYLLRPVSRNSIMSSMAADGEASNSLYVRRLSPGDRPRSPAARSPMRDKMRMGDMRSNNSSFNQSGEASVSSQGGGSTAAKRMYEKSLTPGVHYPQTQHNRRLRKQRTTESAPFTQSGNFGGSSRNLPRQHSNASAYSANIPTSYSHQGITLVRGASCSLVDIPTYLGPSLASAGGVELAQKCDLSTAICKTVPLAAPALQDSQRKNLRPRLQLDLTRKSNSTATNAKSQRKSLSRTVLCVSLTLLTLAVTLVGTMLSVGSQYQDKVMAKHWGHSLTSPETTSSSSDNNSSDFSSSSMLDEQFVIVPDNIELIAKDNGGKESAEEAEKVNSSSITNLSRVSKPKTAASSFKKWSSEAEMESEDLPPIIFPVELKSSPELLDIVASVMRKEKVTDEESGKEQGKRQRRSKSRVMRKRKQGNSRNAKVVSVGGGGGRQVIF